jgi:L-iditol 2-dehydrogenase
LRTFAWQETREIPKAADGNAVVRLIATGLCGSDRESALRSRAAARAARPSHQVAMAEVPCLSPCPVHYYTHGRNGAFILQSPLVLGHEAGGEVVELPPNYSGELEVGDRVAVVRRASSIVAFLWAYRLTTLLLCPRPSQEAGVNCKKCKYCKAGSYNLCVAMEFCSSAKTFPHRDGTLQEFMLHPVDYLYK